MTTYNKTQLKAFFEQGDIPGGTDYANLIDSQINIVETSEQMMAGNLNAPKLITSLVSATTLNAVSVNAILVSAGTVNGTTINTATVSATTRIFTTDVSAASTVYASAFSTQTGIKGKVTIVSAAGSTRATAAALDISYIFRGQGVVDGITTGFLLAAPNPGVTQYFFLEGAASANLYPVGSDYTINALASGLPFAMAAKTLYTIAHVTTSAYGVK